MSASTTYRCDGDGCGSTVQVPYPGSFAEGWAIVSLSTDDGCATAHACSPPCARGIAAHAVVLFQAALDRSREKRAEAARRTAEHQRYRKHR